MRERQAETETETETERQRQRSSLLSWHRGAMYHSPDPS